MRAVVGSALPALVALCLSACGGGAASSRDAQSEAGDVASEAGDAAAEVGLDGSAAFMVTATFSRPSAEPPPSQLADFPMTGTFNLFVDAQALRAVTGALGRANAVALRKTDSGFAATEPVTIPMAFDQVCGGVVEVIYSDFAFAVIGGRLTGTGSGAVAYIVGDVRRTSRVNATFVGLADTDLPTLLPVAATIDPMGEALFSASEPLAVSSAASLIGEGGDTFALGAVIADGPPSFTTGFVRSTLMLNWATTYELTSESLIDLAGHAGSRAARPKVATPPVPPLAAEDGFESVASPSFGGARVVEAGPLGPLAGAKSLIVGGAYGTEPLALRLPIHAGDTVVRFAARLVTHEASEAATFPRQVRVGVPGREVSVVSLPPTKTMALAGSAEGVYVGAVSTIEVPLPIGANGEVSFEIEKLPVATCGFIPDTVALVIDDLRVE